jgi:hypothetical protein
VVGHRRSPLSRGRSRRGGRVRSLRPRGRSWWCASPLSVQPGPEPPWGQIPGPSAARTFVVVCIVASGFSRGRSRRGDTSRGLRPRGRSWWCAWSPLVQPGPEPPWGQIPVPSAARTLVVVCIGAPSRESVGVATEAGRRFRRERGSRPASTGSTRREARGCRMWDGGCCGGMDGWGPRRTVRASGGHPCGAAAGPGRLSRCRRCARRRRRGRWCGAAWCSSSVSRWDRCPGPCRLGRAWWCSSVLRCRRRVDEALRPRRRAAGAAGDQPCGSILTPSPAPMLVWTIISGSPGSVAVRVDGCSSLPAVSRPGLSRNRRRRGRACGCSSWPPWWCTSPQPSGSMQDPLPARTLVFVVIVLAPGGVWRQPSGSRLVPCPARSCVVVRIASTPSRGDRRLSRWDRSRSRRRRGRACWRSS